MKLSQKADKINTDEVYIKLSDIENIVRYEFEVLNNHTYKGVKE